VRGNNSITNPGGFGAESKTSAQQSYNLDISYSGWSFARIEGRKLRTSGGWSFAGFVGGRLLTTE